tara:strand:+ start:46973 stop:47251 length:279 start_codon:yes stop_codon:yes gene_type:complete
MTGLEMGFIIVSVALLVGLGLPQLFWIFDNKEDDMGMKMKVTKPEDLANGDDGSSWQDDLFKLSCIPPELLTDKEHEALLNKIKARKLREEK